MRPQTLSTERREIISRNPATGEENGRAPITGLAEVLEEIKRARLATDGCAKLSYRERSQTVLRARELVLAKIEEIALTISRETGKPRAEAISMEVVPTLDLMHYFAVNTAKLLKTTRIDIGQYGLMGRSSK